MSGESGSGCGRGASGAMGELLEERSRRGAPGAGPFVTFTRASK
jgi:hypothetical protein